jgi:RNA polymerase-binding transcription factor DksA
MAKSKRYYRRMIIFELLKHLKSDFDVELSQDEITNLFRPDAGIDALLSFRSDSRLDELHGALERLESGTFGFCVSCKLPIPHADLDSSVTRRVCPSCEAAINV